MLAFIQYYLSTFNSIFFITWRGSIPWKQLEKHKRTPGECIWVLPWTISLSSLWFPFLAESCAIVAIVVQGSRHLVNGKNIQAAERKNGNIVW